MSLQHTDMVRTLEQIEESALIQLVYASSITVMARFNKSLFADVKGGRVLIMNSVLLLVFCATGMVIFYSVSKVRKRT